MSGHVVLGVSGGIAAYKAVEVLRLLQKAGLDVRACLTSSATRFVTPLTFAAISGHPVTHGRLGGMDPDREAAMAHVEVTRGAALFLVVPATADVIARLAAGMADDWLTTHALASEAPLLLAPAMNQRMLRHAAVRANLATLVARGATIVPPGDGDLACGEVGAGRLAEPADIVAAALRLIGASRDLEGRTLLVTSGPTFEDLDDVRFIGNRSSGKMGHAIAEQARRRGARVRLVSGPSSVELPAGCEVTQVRSADEMAAAVARALPGVDAAFFAAAVSDYRPRRTPGKIRREDRDTLLVEMERTPDILASAVATHPKALLVGFAAEVGEGIEAQGHAKLARKGCDMLVVNRVDGLLSAFDADDNEVLLLVPGRDVQRVERAGKDVIADRILDAALVLLRAREESGA